MKPLSQQEILALLGEMDADELREKHRNRLDEAGLAFLAEEARKLEAVEDLFHQTAAQIREADPAPDIDLSHIMPPTAAPWWRRRTAPNWLFAMAATLALGFGLLFSAEWLGWVLNPGIETVRSGSLDMEDLGPLNQALARALIERGEFLMRAGRAEDKREHFEEALYDFLQAYELDPANATLLAHLAQVYEKLGNEKKAEESLKKWQATNQE